VASKSVSGAARDHEWPFDACVLLALGDFRSTTGVMGSFELKLPCMSSRERWQAIANNCR
jgi:hypothetical protein